MWKRVLRAWSDEEGVMSVEYAILLAALVVVAIGTWTTFGTIIRTKVASSSNQVNNMQ